MGDLPANAARSITTQRMPGLHARYFGVLFDKVPRYTELDCRIPENEKNSRGQQASQASFAWNVFVGADKRT